MSTTIKSNLNGSTNGCSLSALKKHINTWRQKFLKRLEQYKGKYQYQKLVNQEEKCSYKFQQNASKRFLKYSCKECSFVQRTTISCKSFNRKVFKYINSRQHVSKESSTILKDDSEGPRRYGRKVEIVAKLLSSTLIAKAKSSTSVTEEREHIFERTLKVLQNSTSNTKSDFYEQNMTITDLTFMELREEYPEINSEIRSILTARAQDGATISQIREDYRKLTGLTFPIYEDVTEFLLTIPFVSAYCNEKGTRIFNIMPSDKTKHIHDMVVNQKTQQEPLQRPASKIYYRERVRNSNYQPLNWRQSTNRRLLENNANYEETPINVKDVENHEQLMPTVETNLSRNYGSEVFYENNCFYQDNCNYLFNRICSQKPQEPLTSHLFEKCPQILTNPEVIPPTNSQTTNLNNFNSDIPSYKNNINHLNNLYQVPEQQIHNRQYEQNLNNLRNTQTRNSSLPYKQKPALPASSRSSSPTVKSWFTNESAFTDSDYEAHLLDFLLLGDDFFLYMARMELRCKFKKNQRVLQSGLCVSGQTIGASIKRLRMSTDQRRSIIVNIGSVDIMQGRQLIQIEHDFRELILMMLKKGIKPILTTLAPLANYSHNYEVKSVLERFNAFIKREGNQRNLIVIDIWKCLVNEKGHVLFDCYQNEPRNVTGTSESYLFWNKIGRQRVLQLIESNLEY